MAHGARDYYFWDMPISVPNGGTGDTSLTLNGVLIGQGGNGIYVTAAGTANQVLRVPSGGGTPAFATLGGMADKSVINLASADVTGILPVANGGTGTNSPGLTAGTGISIAWAWPGQLVTNTSAYATLADPLPVAHGGTGTTTPTLSAGTGISIAGTWPAQTITNTSPASALGDPVTVAHGGSGTATPSLVAGTGISIAGSWPAQTINCTSAYATLADPLPIAHGGTGTTTPGLVAGTGIQITGTWPAQTITNTSAYATLADPLTVAHGGTGTTTPALVAGTGIQITGSWPAQTITNTSAYATLADPLAVAHGGTGTASPALVAGTNISISGSWPAQTVAVVASPSFASMTITGTDPTISFAQDVGGGGYVHFDGWGNIKFPSLTSAGHYWGVSDKNGSWVITASGDGSKAVTLGSPLPVSSGGTGTASPALVAGANISITGSWPAQTIALVASPSISSLSLTATTTNITFGGTAPSGGHVVLDQWATMRFPSDSAAGYSWTVVDKSGVSVIQVYGDGTKVVALALPLAVTSGGTGVGTCSAGQHLVGTGANTAAFVTPDGCRVYNSAAESIATATPTALTFDSERYNNGSMHSTVTNPSRITAQKAGVYQIIGTVDFAANVTGIRALGIRLNGATTIAYVQANATSANTCDMMISTLYHLAVGEYVELWVTQTSGGALNVSAVGNYSPEFAAQWLGP